MFNPATWSPRDCDRQLEWSGSPKDIADACTQLEASDHKAERARPLWLLLATILGGGTFIVGMGLRTWWITLTGLAIAGLLGRKFLKADRKDIEERKVSLLRTILDALAGELRTGMPLRVKLDLRAYWHYEPDEAWMTLSLHLANRVELGVRLITAGEWEYDPGEEEQREHECAETLVVSLSAPEGYSIIEGEVPARRPKLGPLLLCRSSVEPKTATFVFATDTLAYEVRDTRGLLSRYTIPGHANIVDAIALCTDSLVRIETDKDVASSSEPQ